VDGLFFLPERRVSLYGTDLWERLSHEQRVELSRHEVASVATAGIWFEMILMQMLLRDTYSVDPTASTAVGAHRDRRRMPALGDVRPDDRTHRRARLPRVPAHPRARPADQDRRLRPSNYAAILIAEEILDRFQREAMKDEQVQPLIRMVSRIHVMEEARHVTFARGRSPGRCRARACPPAPGTSS